MSFQIIRDYLSDYHVWLSLNMDTCYLVLIISFIEIVLFLNIVSNFKVDINQQIKHQNCLNEYYDYLLNIESYLSFY